MEQSHSSVVIPRRARYSSPGSSSSSEQSSRSGSSSPSESEVRSRRRAPSLTSSASSLPPSLLSTPSYTSHAKLSFLPPMRTQKSEPLYLEDLGPKYAKLAHTHASTKPSKLRAQDASKGGDVPPTFYDKMLSITRRGSVAKRRPMFPREEKGARRGLDTQPRKKREWLKSAIRHRRISNILQIAFLLSMWSARELLMDATSSVWELLGPVGVVAASTDYDGLNSR